MGLIGFVGDAVYLVGKGVLALFSTKGVTTGGSKAASLLMGTAIVGGIGTAGYMGYQAYTNPTPSAVAIPSQYQGQAEAPTPAAPTTDQTFTSAKFKPMNSIGKQEQEGYNAPVLKRTAEAIKSGRLDSGDGAFAQPTAVRQQAVSIAPAAPAPSRGPTLEQDFVTQYERAFADSMQVMMSDASKKSQMDREKAKIFDQIANIVFPQPKTPALKEAMDYIQTRQKEDPQAIADLVKSLQFLEEASKEQ